MYQVVARFHQSIRRDGYVFLRNFDSRASSSAAIGRFGKIERIGAYDSVHELSPRESGLVKNTYSGAFGYGSFPLHNDLAHWFRPPRYVVLRCLVGARDVKTLLLDTSAIITKIGKRRLQSGLVQPRRPLLGHRALLRILDGDEVDGSIFRWDSMFLVPATEGAHVIFEDVAQQLDNMTPVEIALAECGDTLIIDNWRVLHGRSAVPVIAQQRRIERSYLSDLR